MEKWTADLATLSKLPKRFFILFWFRVGLAVHLWRRLERNCVGVMV